MEWKAVWRQAEQGEFLQKNNPDRKRRLHALRRLLLMVLAAVLIGSGFMGQALRKEPLQILGELEE